MKHENILYRICAFVLALTMLLSIYSANIVGVVWAEMDTDGSDTVSTPVDTTPVDTTPVDITPVDITPVDITPVDTTPADTTPVDTTPADTTPEDTTPEDTTPVDTTPVDTTPVDTTPEDTTPEDTTPETDAKLCAECGGSEGKHIATCSQARKQYITRVTAPDGSTYAITVEGILPDGMMATVTAPDAGFLPEFDMLAKKMIFAYDITVYDADRNVWQPQNGEIITLSIDAALIGMNEGETVEIYHAHNGIQSELGEVKVIDGKITFKTTGFSVFYGVQPIGATPEYIYFDLAAGNVTLNGTTYTGYIYVTNGTTTVSQKVSGTHLASNKYYVYQSVSGNRSITGLVNGEFVLPVYDEMYADGKAWGEYVTNNTNVKGVVAAWPTAAAAVGRTSTGNRIEITGSGNSTFYVTVDNIWSSYVTASTSRTTGGISFLPKANDAATIYLHGNTRVDNIHYSSNLNTNQIVFEDSPFPGTGTLTAASTNGSSNHYNSVIGGNDSGNAAHEASKGIVINSGNVFAGAQVKDNCSAIGGGGNGHGIVTINGGTVTAVVSSSGAAIGGGIGESSYGGMADITITGGTIYAYNFSFISEYTYLPIPAAAIGGGSTCKSNGQHANITITGGTIYAQSTGGAAIGGGSSTMLAGGSTTINISGNPTIEARSVGGSVYSVSGTSQTVAPGISIGGGTAGNASTSTGSGGYAELTVHGGTLKTGSIGGGVCNNKKGTLGYAKVTITGGTIQGQIIMAKGAAPCSFTMTGGLIDNTNSADYNFIKPDGGAVNMDDDRGVAEISGGTIRNCSANNGGAVFMTNGRFILSGGVIESCSASNYGGAVYLGGGSVTLSNGRISNCISTTGGAIYLQGGNVSISGSTIENCFAEHTDALGGAIYVTGGNVSMTGGTIRNCYTTVPGEGALVDRINGRGGAVYITNGEMDMSGGTITDCKSTNGGAIYLPGGNFTMTGGNILSNDATNEGGGVYLAGGSLTLNGGNTVIGENTAVNGAGVYLTGGAPNLYYGTLSDNIASGNGGGIFIDKQIVTLTPTSDVNFIGNKAVDGAGMYILGDPTTPAGFAVNASSGRVVFKENIASGNGGGVCLYYGDMTIANEQISLFGNQATNGGGAAVLNGSFSLTGGSVGVDENADNTAINGGGVYVSGGNVTVSDTGTITNNTATNGGGVYLTGGMFTLDGENTYIQHNTAENGGGVYLTQINPTLLSGNITGNTATFNGGGIYISKQEVILDPTGTVNIACNIAKHHANATNGGGIYIEGTEDAPAGFKVTNTYPEGKVVLDSNESQTGGGVCVNNGYFHIDHNNIVITNNVAENGGGIAVLSGNFVMKAGSIGESGKSNIATNGGGVYVAGGAVTINNGTVAHNTATNGGGAYVSGGGLILNNGSFVSNSVSPTGYASANGGGFFVQGGSFTMNGGTVTNNTANASVSGFGGYGGGFFVQNGSFTMNGGTISQNIACSSLTAGTPDGGLGGGGYIDGGDFIMKKGVIGGDSQEYANSAVDGGGIYVSDGNVTIYNGKIQYNSASMDGGGIFVSSQTMAVNVIMLSGYLCNNTAGECGGGVAVRSPEGASTAITVKIGCLLDHTDEYPLDYTGAYEIYAEQGANVHAFCPQVAGNTAGLFGGGFYLDSSASSLYYYCIIEDPASPNTANGNHSCHSLDVEGGKVEIGDSLYHNHEVKYSHTTAWGNVQLFGSVLVNGGTVDIYGDMDNPMFADKITVNIQDKEKDRFTDHRRAKITDGKASHYKIHYTENFFGTGEYIANQYETANDGTCNVVISGTTFERTGYKIIGWNTNPNGTGTSYKVGSSYDLTTLRPEDGMGNDTDCEICAKNGLTDPSLLVLYAQWQKKGYVIRFVANAPSGATCTGEMSDFPCTQDTLETLPKNQFKCTGYKFAGWSYSPDGHKVFDDQGKVFNLTMEDSQAVYLYALWEICTHTNLTYSAVDHMLIQTCGDCDGHMAIATVSATNAEYDGNQHPAAVGGDINTPNWLGDAPVLRYFKIPDPIWDDLNNPTDQMWCQVGSLTAPINAGIYSAQLSAGGAVAECGFTISRVQWPTPETPACVAVVVDGMKGIQITTPTAPTSSSQPQYMYGSQYVTDDVLTEMVWTDDIVILTPHTNTFYYIYAKAKEDRNHIESDNSLSIRYLTDQAMVEFLLEHGIAVTYASADGDNTYSFTTSVMEGFHKRGWSVTLYLKENLDTPIASCTPNEFGQYVLTGLSADKNYCVKITGVAANGTVESQAIHSQVFSNFTGIPAVDISCDSAFTVQYTVKNYRPDEYRDQRLTFDKTLPAGTALIMLADGKYWHHTLTSPTDSLPLTIFREMGTDSELTDSEFRYDKKGSTPKDFTYQFIVDFSRASSYASVGPLTVAFETTVNEQLAGGVSNEAPELKGNHSIYLQPAASFALDCETVASNRATVSYTYTPSDGRASIWDNRDASLVVTLNNAQTIPSDLSLSVYANGQTTRYIMKPGYQFIIPMGSLTNGTNTLQLQFNSELILAGASESGLALPFTVKWIVSETVADKSPLNGDVVAFEKVDCNLYPTAVPSLKITAPSRLCSVSEAYNVTIQSQNIPDDWKLTLYLYRKDTTTGSQNYEQFIYTGYYENLSKLNTQQNLDVSLLGQEPGSFYLVVIATTNEGANQIIMAQTRYYFIAQD